MRRGRAWAPRLVCLCLAFGSLVFATSAYASTISGNAGTGGAEVEAYQSGALVATAFSDPFTSEYSLSVPPGAYDVTPTKAAYDFSPASQPADVSSFDMSGVDFTATAIPPINQPPSASLSVSPPSGNAPLQVTFNGSGSTDDSGIDHWTLDFGDNTSTTGNGTPGASISHTYMSRGSKTATLTAYDAGGLSSSDTATTTANGAPTANLSSSPSPASGTAPLNVSFTASGADPEGDPISWTLTFGDGGSASGTGLPATVPHQYAAGSYTATLTVTDSHGASSTDTVAVNSSTPPDRAPTATLTATPSSGRVPLTVGFGVSGSDPDGDPLSYTLSFGDGNSVSGSAPASPAHTYTAAGTYTATLTMNDGRGGSDTDSKTITVNPQPTLSIDNVSVTEGASGPTSATFTVTLSGASDKTVTADADTADGTATAGGSNPDYQATHASLSFSPGQTQKTVTVLVNGDLIDEPNETFTVNLSGATNATIADGQGVGTIIDDDSPPTLSITSTSVLEGDGGTTDAFFTVSLSSVSGRQVTVNYATGGVTATSNVDFQARSGVLTFAPGETSKTIAVPVVGDTLDESNETFTVTLSVATNATIPAGQGTGTGTIIDDDGAPSLSILDAVPVTEGNSGTTPAIFQVTLAPASGQTVTVSYMTAAGTAVAGADYGAKSGQLTFAPGQTTQTITVSVIGDTIDEPDETFFVRLSGAVNASISDNEGKGIILDDDSPPSIPPPTVTTGAASGITQTSATVSGTVNPNGRATTVRFDYGITADYGTRTGDQSLSGSTAKSVAATLTGLGPGTTYHYRVVATNDAGGSSYGTDQVFTTASPPPPPPPPTTTTTTTTPPAVKRTLGPNVDLPVGIAKVFGGKVVLYVSCPDEACTGSVDLKTVVRTTAFLSGAVDRTVELGSGAFALAKPGTAATVIKLTKEGRTLLAKRHRIQAAAFIVARNRDGSPTSVAKSVVLRVAVLVVGISPARVTVLPSGLVQLVVSCPTVPGAPTVTGACRGRMTLWSTPVKGRPRKLGREPFALLPGRRAVVAVLLNAQTRKLLLRRKQLKVKAIATARIVPSIRTTNSRIVRLKAPARGFN